jgi:hypothetical protein
VSDRRDGNLPPRPWKLAGAVDVYLDGTSMLCGEYDQSVVSDLSWDWIGCGFSSYVGLHEIQIGKHPIISGNPPSRIKEELPLRLLISHPNQPHQDTKRGRGPQPIPRRSQAQNTKHQPSLAMQLRTSSLFICCPELYRLATFVIPGLVGGKCDLRFVASH